MTEKNTEPNNDPNGTGDGNPNGNQNGNPTAQDVKNLQKIISEKDKALKEAEQKLENFGQANSDEKKQMHDLISGLEKQIGELVGQVGKFNADKRALDLAKRYPDILPDLLAGKNDEEVEKIVLNQRELSKKIYGDSQFFQQPTYKDSADIDKAIEITMADKKKSGIEAAVDVLKLSRLKNLIH